MPSIDFYSRAVDVKDGRFDETLCRPMITDEQIVSAYVLGSTYQQQRIEEFKPRQSG